MAVTENPFLDAWASAVVAKQISRDVLSHLEEGHDGACRNMHVVAPVSGAFPEHPLDTAVRDLALAARASAHAAEAACRAGDADQARAVGHAARCAAEALALIDAVAVSAQRRTDADERVRVAHAVAATAFAAAQLVAPGEGPMRKSHVEPVFPASWVRLIQILGVAIDECGAGSDDGRRRRLRNAAMAARDGAEAARHGYDKLRTAGTTGPAVARFVRVASLAAAYAGCAALVPLRAGGEGS